jgi:hypothetical protein
MNENNEEIYATQTREEKSRNEKIFKCILYFYFITLFCLLCTKNYNTFIYVALFPFVIYLLTLVRCYLKM